MDVYACDHTKELIIKAHNNDKSAREKLVIDNSGLVWSIVKRFTCIMVRSISALTVLNTGWILRWRT